MGKDKGLLTYYSTPQLEHLTQLLKPFCDQTYVSAKHKSDYPDFSIIEDQYTINSPLNGILSALTSYRANAWLVIACDMPFIDAISIEYLIKYRSIENLVACYQNDEQQPEPLFCIWEPQAFTPLYDFQAVGELSPRKFLSSNVVSLIDLLDPKVLTNVNTLEEFDKYQFLKPKSFH